ncbi:MAG: chemotaxis protein CheA [Acidobacteriales bacterium]|nr:chemotaxis protein CheA [Terriglobales bacterium]
MTHFDDPGEEMRELFLETAQELLQSLNEEALKLEKRPDDGEAVRSLRRGIHTLKGDAAACGFRELSELAHKLEDALAPEHVGPNASLAELAFTAADTFAAMLAAYRDHTALPSIQSLDEILVALSAGTKRPGATKNQNHEDVATQGIDWSEYELLASRQSASLGKSVHHVSVLIDPGCTMPIAARQMVLNALNALGQVLGSRPESDSAGLARELDFLFASGLSAEEIVAKCKIPTIISQVDVETITEASEKTSLANPGAQILSGEISTTPHSNEEPARASDSVEHSADSVAAEPATDPGGLLPHHAAENILRVDAERVDALLNLVGELIIGKSMLQQAVNELSKRYPKEPLRARLADAVALQARVLSDLQRSVMKVRMVPVEQLFRRFPRLVRDVARRCGKNVQLIISGETTDLDKSLLDTIAEPLTHLIRNAVSHGIESPPERRQQGKPAEGTIHLSAYHQGNQVIISVRDDGAGIALDRVKAKAVAQHLVAASESQHMDQPEVLELLFHPGFSTADEITEISGRGVGLDVVRSVLRRLKGNVEIETRIGSGTTFHLKVPLTLAIIKALLFRIEQRLYAIPLNAVAEIARARESDLHQVENYEVLQLRDQVLPLVRLGMTASESTVPDRRIFVLVIASGGRKFGLIVDGIEGEEELVIKPLDDHMVATDLVSGASILGDGRVVLIVNLAAIMERSQKSRRKESQGGGHGLLLPQAERALGLGVPAEVRL